MRSKRKTPRIKGFQVAGDQITSSLRYGVDCGAFNRLGVQGHVSIQDLTPFPLGRITGHRVREHRPGGTGGKQQRQE